MGKPVVVHLPRCRPARRSRATGVHGAATWRRPPTSRWRWPSGPATPRGGDRRSTTMPRRGSTALAAAHGADAALRARHLLRRHVLLRGAAVVLGRRARGAVRTPPPPATSTLADVRRRAAAHDRRHGRRRVHPGPAASDDRPGAAQRAHRGGAGGPVDGGAAVRRGARLRRAPPTRSPGCSAARRRPKRRPRRAGRDMVGRRPCLRHRRRPAGPAPSSRRAEAAGVLVAADNAEAAALVGHRARRERRPERPPEQR